MATEPKPSFMKGAHLFIPSNNITHHTSEISTQKLIVRRGEAFIVSVRLRGSFDPSVNPITITAKTGEDPQKELGTLSSFTIPPGKNDELPSKNNVVWVGRLNTYSSFWRGVVTFFITPPPNCPIGKYKLLIKYKGKEEELADLTVLFNPWCQNDAVFLPFERKRMEYVLNEQGVVYRGSTNYIMPLDWDFGQFEEDMVDICMAILDNSLSHINDPAQDVANRGDPAYVGRVISAMVNNVDDQGILAGNWSGDYSGGYSPTHWSSSHVILSKWYKSNFRAVKYGQCWVFACVMCSVMRLLGIPCRVITNFASAHDTNRDLKIELYRDKHGVTADRGTDSIWNFHVWVEGWFTRPDLSVEGLLDGWQVLDPTPQETSGGIYRCGPCPVKGIKKGQTNLSYDMPFVYAEVNGDVIIWLVEGKEETVVKQEKHDTKRVGQKISTKAVGLKRRRDVTSSYKFKEGTKQERDSYNYAASRDYSFVDEFDAEYEDEEDSEDEVEDQADPLPDETPPPEVSLRFIEDEQPINGKDVKMILVMHSNSSVPRELIINISVQAMRYNGTLAGNIKNEEIVRTLLPGEDLTYNVVIPYSAYHSHMVTSDSMKLDAFVTEKGVPEHIYLTECDVVLLDPSISIVVTDSYIVGVKSKVEVIFDNPIDDWLTNCNLTVSGSGLYHDEFECKLPDLSPDNKMRIVLYFSPYKAGEKTLLVDFDCSEFKDIKASATIRVNP